MYLLTITEASVSSNSLFALDGAATSALEVALSSPRLATFLAATAGDMPRALRLHGWNAAISSAFLGPLQYLELALRNALDRELTNVYGDRWFGSPTCGLAPLAAQSIAQAQDEARRDGKTLDPPNIIARLSFGFWVSLLQKNMETVLWRPCLHRAFPHGRINRRDAHQRLDHLRRFRNRIAHHEPIFHRHLQADYESILIATGWICPTTRDWITHHSRVDALLPLRHDGCESF